MNDELKEFEKWLRQDDLFEYHKKNPEQQQRIFNDYKSEMEYIKPKHYNDWLKLIFTEIEWAKQNYPETMEGLAETIKESPPYVTAARIQQIPEFFTKWKTNIDDYLKSTIDKEIRTFSELIDLILYRLEFNSDIENNAVNNIKPELLEMEDYIKRLLTNRPKQQTKTSYVWQGNPNEELPELYSLLTNEYKLISPETTQEQFTAIFTGQPLQDIKPIQWNAAKNLNAYFIEQLIQLKKISKAINNDVWKIAKQCFVNGTNFSQIIDQYSNSKAGKPKHHNLIDDVLNTL